MEFFNYEGHRKLWLLLSENIQIAARKNYSGNGYYNAYGALDKLKKELLCLHFLSQILFLYIFFGNILAMKS